MRKQLVWIIFVLERIQPRQFPCSIPSQLPFIAMPIINIDFDVAGVSAARRDEDTAHVATDLGSGGGEGAVCEADVEEARVWEDGR